MRIAIRFSRHALKRLSKRCLKFGLDAEEAEELAKKAIRYGKQIKVKHKNGYSLVHYLYFRECFSFYVVSKVKITAGCRRFKVKTVIIKWGRR